TLGQEEARWVLDLEQAPLGHLKDADLVRRAEAILHGTQDSISMMLFALEVQHRVDQVLENARSSQRSLLGDVPDQKRRNASPLGDCHETSPALPDLGHAPWRRLQSGQKHGLDRVDDQNPRLYGVELRLHRAEIGLRPQE